MDISISNKKSNTSYSVKKLLKQIFKQQKSFKKVIADSMESLENSRNASLESDCAFSMESFENDINEQLTSEKYYEEEEMDSPTTVPVHFVRTEQGTFFWTTSSGDEQLYCMQDRWAQA
ncbi:enhancer of split m4 protein-like [Musca autumnalis]|uniref:enhancer of split m4 protein-like n=1 Tax=Musca autumnalis TaxID=221902 RepID=UPI003CF4E3D0